MENKEIIGKFYGCWKIENVFSDTTKTFFGDEYVNLLLDSGVTEFLPKKVVEIVITDAKSDLTGVQNKLFSVIIPQILSIMADYNLNLFDTAGLINRLDMSVKENYSQAVAKIFNRDNEQKITLMQLNEILKPDKK